MGKHHEGLWNALQTIHTIKCCKCNKSVDDMSDSGYDAADYFEKKGWIVQSKNWQWDTVLCPDCKPKKKKK